MFGKIVLLQAREKARKARAIREAKEKKNSTEAARPTEIIISPKNLSRLPHSLYMHTVNFLDIKALEKLAQLQLLPLGLLKEMLQKLFKLHRFTWPTENTRFNRLVAYFKRLYNLEYRSISATLLATSDISKIIDVKNGRVPKDNPRQWMKISGDRIYSMTYIASMHSTELLAELYKIAKINRIPSPSKEEYNELHWKAACQIENIEKELAECSDDDKAFCLFLATQHNHVEAMNHLLHIKPDLLKRPFSFDRTTPLHLAAQYGHADIVRLLIEKGAIVDATNIYNRTALHLAAERGHLGIVRLLIENGAIVDAIGFDKYTALHVAIQYGHTAIAALLIEKRADVNVIDPHGVSPLHLVAQYDHANLVRLLVENGASVYATNYDGNTPLHLAAQYGHANIVRLLIEKGAIVDATNIYNDTALHLAAQNGHLGIVRLLIENGAIVDAINFDKYTALHLADQRGHAAIVELLIASRASVNTPMAAPLDEATAQSSSHRRIVKG